MVKAVQPVEKVLNVTETKQQFSKLINEVARGESHVLIEKSGEPVAAIISPQELAEYRSLKARDSERLERLERELATFSNAFRDLPIEEFERELADAHQEFREKSDREHARS